ncbi:MAG: efflux RND transporter periplasmic adaptor subunit [Candidatus Binatales bacterium]
MIARKFRVTRPARACLAIAVLAVAGCKGSPAASVAHEPSQAIAQLVQQAGGPELMKLDQKDVPGMRFAAVTQVELPAVLETSGQISFDDRRVASIVSRVTGRIDDTRVSLWDTVRRGEPIVSLYSPDFMTAQAEYLQALSTSNLSAMPGIADTGGLASAMVSAAKRKLELLGMRDSDIAALKAPSPTVWMRAPIGGIVVDNKAIRGGAVNPGDVLFSVGTLDEVWVTADVYEDDLARVHEGQQLEAVTTAFPDQVFKGTIAKISPNIDPNTHTAQIRCEVRNPGGKLKPQMLARVRILTPLRTALAAPLDALIFESNSYFAYVDAGNGLFEQRKVLIAPCDRQGYARVVSGLAAGERVVIGETIQVDELWHRAHGEGS